MRDVKRAEQLVNIDIIQPRTQGVSSRGFEGTPLGRGWIL